MTLRGYPGALSVAPGEDLAIHVSTGAERFRARFHRIGARLEEVGVTGPLPGRWCPEGPPDEDWAWPEHRWTVPDTWRSGIYVAVLEALDEAAPADGSGTGPVEVDARDARFVFVVRSQPDAEPRPILYKVPFCTYHAYNATGGGSLYVDQAVDATGRARVTFLRPGGGSGGDLSFPEAVDVYDPGTPREGVAHWDLPFVAWLEAAGYQADYCADVDLDRDGDAALDGRSLLLSAGHDEYWSETMRDAVERFARRGGNVAFFGGNTCFWRVRIEPGGTGMSCRHPDVAAEDADQWWRTRPENSLTGVGYRGGGGWWAGPRDPLGYTVVRADHWIFAGTGLADGDELAGPERLVGYECDGAHLDPAAGGRPQPSGTDGTPVDFEVLGMAPLSERWQDRPAGAAAVATLGVHRPGGTVFSASTTDWPRVLQAGHPGVERITRNVLDALRLPPVVLRAPSHAVAGSTVTLHVAHSSAGEPAVVWWASAGDLEPDGASAALHLPDGPGRVSVTARAEGPSGARFGHVSVLVLTPREAAQVALVSLVHSLALTTPPAPVPTLPAGPGNQPLASAAWDPVRDGLRRPLTADDVAWLRERANRLSALVAEMERQQGGQP
ncbi:MAG: hypothetical protein HYX34_09925 [Actinobacteria bacterium]|nr:hypothetical protein [Actinomycetota bacterium]